MAIRPAERRETIVPIGIGSNPRRRDHQASAGLPRESDVSSQLRLQCLGRLAAAFAHNFNDILSIISVYVEILSDPQTLLDPLEVADALTEIRSAVERGALLTRQMLSYEQTRPEVREPSPGCRVLLVDEDELLQPLLTTIMSRFGGHKVVVASDSAKALEILRQQPVDLVLTSIAPRGGMGFELCHRLYADSPQLPIVLMTSGPVPDGLPRSYPALAKPFDMKELLSAVQLATAG